MLHVTVQEHEVKTPIVENRWPIGVPPRDHTLPSSQIAIDVVAPRIGFTDKREKLAW